VRKYCANVQSYDFKSCLQSVFHRIVLLVPKDSRASLQLSPNVMWRYESPEEFVDVWVITSARMYVDVTSLCGPHHRVFCPAINRKFYEIYGIHIQRLYVWVCVGV
jgi:hypothetical protein